MTSYDNALPTPFLDDSRPDQAPTYPRLGEEIGLRQGAAPQATPLPEDGALLNLLEEHLTEGKGETQYRRAFHAGYLMKNWLVDEAYTPPPSGERSVVLKIQEFAAGGYEAVVKLMDLEAIGDAMDRPKRFGKRERPDELNESHMVKAGQRAKRKVRYLTKNMGANHLVTLSFREGPNTTGWSAEAWAAWDAGGSAKWIEENGPWKTRDEWAACFDKFRRLLEKAQPGCPYVAVLEDHRKGNLHLHLAWVGRVKLNLVRPIWWAACGGRGLGGVHVRPFTKGKACDKASKIAHYISKYVAKGFETSEDFNKKRYWASRQSMADVRRYILRCTDVVGALGQLIEWLQLKVADQRNFMLFPDEQGFWWNYVPGLHGRDPPF